jgi:transcriptional regulator with XRE-family HTH domain
VPTMVHIGERLRELRTRKYLTQRELAARAGMSPATIAKLETDVAEPRPGTIRKLAAALEVHPDKLTGFGSDG